jgi:hypothetical protein
MYRRGLLSSLALVPSLAGCSHLDGATRPDSDAETTPDERAELVTHELVREAAGTDEETVAIEGAVRINQDGLQHVELRGRFFDAEDEPLDTTFERLRELAVGTQPFEIRYPELGPAAAAVEGDDIEITTVV